MFVQDAMTRSVITVTPHTTLRQAAAVLSEHHITSLPVVAPDGQLLGVVGEADIVRESLVRDQRTLVVRLPTEDGVSVEEVEQVMTRQPITVRPDAELADAARVMADFRRKSLPVTDDGRVVGMISRADVVRQLARHDRQIAAEIHHRAREDSYDWMIEVDNGVVTFGGVASENDRHHARLLASAVEGVRGIQFRH